MSNWALIGEGDGYSCSFQNFTIWPESRHLGCLFGPRQLIRQETATVLYKSSVNLECKARSTPATMLKQRSTLLPKTATMSNEFCVEISSFRQSRTLLRHCC